MVKNQVEKIEDPILKNKSNVSFEIKNGKFVNIPSKNIKVVSSYLQNIMDLSSKGKEINVLGVFENANTIFRDPYIKNKDTLWKEHLAGSLREPFDRGFSSGMYNAFKKLPKRDYDDVAKIFWDNFQKINQFLNNLTHMRYELALDYVKEKHPDATDVTEEFFDEICEELIKLLYDWFSTFLYKGTN